MACITRALSLFLLITCCHLPCLADFTPIIEPEWQTFGSKQYYFVMDALRDSDETRNQAAHACRRMNAFLVSIETPDQLDFLKHEIESRVHTVGQEFAHEQWWTSGRRQRGKWIWNDDISKLVNTDTLGVGKLPQGTEDSGGDFLTLEYQHDTWCLTPTPRNFRLRYVCEKGISFIPTLGHEGHLIKNLLAGYEKDSRGSGGQGEATHVRLSFTVTHVHSLDQNVLVTSSILQTEWEDSRLAWYPPEHKNISHLVLKTNRIWTPHLEILNSVARSDAHHTLHNDHVTVTYEGRVTLTQRTQLHTTCSMSLRLFPFDSHRCPVEVGVGLYPTVYVNISNATRGIRFEGALVKSWLMSKSTVEWFKSSDTHAALRYHLVLQRASLHLLLCLLLPLAVLSSLALSLWWVPYRASQRTGACLGVLVATWVLRALLTSSLPRSLTENAELNVIDTWFCALYVLLLYSTLASIILLNILDSFSLQTSKQTSLCAWFIWRLLPKSSKIQLLPVPEKPQNPHNSHKDVEETVENASNELDALRAKLLYADKIGYCDGLQTTNIDDVELTESKLHLRNSGSQTDAVAVPSTSCDRIYAENCRAAIASVDRVLFAIYLLLLSISIALVVTVVLI